MTFDIHTLDLTGSANAGTDVELFHPGTKARLPIVITVSGADSDRYKRADREKLNRRITTMKSGGDTSMTAEEMEDERVDMIAACVIGWSGIGWKNTTSDLEFSLDNVKMVFRARPWIMEQVESAMKDRSRFLK